MATETENTEKRRTWNVFMKRLARQELSPVWCWGCEAALGHVYGPYHVDCPHCATVNRGFRLPNLKANDYGN
jgi:hypothetical protein